MRCDKKKADFDMEAAISSVCSSFGVPANIPAICMRYPMPSLNYLFCSVKYQFSQLNGVAGCPALPLTLLHPTEFFI